MMFKSLLRRLLGGAPSEHEHSKRRRPDKVSSAAKAVFSAQKLVLSTTGALRSL